MAKLSFEKALEQLEQIVQEMEAGELTLENALKKFEEGIKLSRYCSQKLDETEKKVTLLMEQADGSIQETPFATEPVDDE
ncbi:MAG: exodeoxyribonuclease VII small subunit [Desulfatitalea sp.]|nr:exodeoxyribonuclease VII small subunit [Desulfatitalea sp.]